VRKVSLAKKKMTQLVGLATVPLGIFVIIAIGGLVISPFTGWDWMPSSVLAKLPGVPGPPEADPIVPLGSLKFVPIPEPPNLGEFVRDRDAAIKLGKALFWDMQVGSDGIQACASCHFAAGADNRSKNQISPGLLGGDTTFNTGGPNHQLESGDFPFHRLENPADRFSTVLSDSNDVTSSMGVALTEFLDIVPGSAEDLGKVVRDPVFNVNDTNTRRVEPRNTPTMINAVFNFDNFWDGRARNIFNGVNPFGELDPDARVLKVSADLTTLDQVRVELMNSSLASQAVGPPLSKFEMSFDGRTFPKLGKKMLSLTPLGKQQVHPEDSVLGAEALPDKGLSVSYKELIQAAFQPRWWDSPLIITDDADGNVGSMEPPAGPLTTDEFSMMEHNFSLFWGIAVQMYEATLVSDDSPFDRMMEGDQDAMTEQQRRGLGLFDSGKTNCSACHQAAEFTNASVSHVSNEILERMTMGNGEEAVYDNGFYNIGVRPTLEDLGRGGTGPGNRPLSHSRLAQQGLFVDTSPEGEPNVTPEERVAVDGAFKVPGLRNVELTAPYFHNGGQLTLRQVVEFYNRGGDFPEQNIDNFDPDIQELGLSERDIDELVAFLRSLTDERVRFRRAPFDHPQLFVPNGHPGSSTSITDDGTGKATDDMLMIPAVGFNGGDPLISSVFSLEPPPPTPTPPPPEQPPGSSTEGPAVSCSAPPGLQGTLDLVWVAHPNPEVVGYNVYRSLVSGGPFEKVNTGLVTDTSFRDTGLTAGTTFHYSITAVDRFGNESPKSAEVSGTTIP